MVYKKAFTIVELLIVIVVVALLAALTAVTFQGIQDRATASVLQSDLKNATTKLKLHYAENGTYPSSTSEVAFGDGIKNSEGVTFRYFQLDDGSNFCLTAISSRATVSPYYSSSAGAIQQGVCSGQSYLVASGGIVSEYIGDGNNGVSGQKYRVHAFTATGTDKFKVDSVWGNASIDYLIVAGGGGGGYRHGAGGGGGGLISGAGLSVSSGDEFEVKVGAGGAGATSSQRAQNGGNSSVGSIVALGGGSGGQWDGYSTGNSGGSGGGSVGKIVAPGQPGQGYSGGVNSTGASPYNHGGGGGAGGVGLNGTVESCGDGGPGLYVAQFSMFGVGGYFAGGGGGGSHDPIPTDNQPGAGGIGGGGASGTPGVNNPGKNALPNTGGGGGGASTASGGTSKGGDGGSGVVLIRYSV